MKKQLQEYRQLLEFSKLSGGRLFDGCQHTSTRSPIKLLE